MGDGIYDLEGKCVKCKKYHPCDCEINSDNRAEKRAEEMELEAQGYSEQDFY
jgi:hypothetical protein